VTERWRGFARIADPFATLLATPLATSLATWFGCGYAPKAPGTAGSLAAVVIAYLLVTYVGFVPLTFFWLAALMLVPAVWSAGKVARDSGTKDPQIVVVDEVIGQWITLIGATSLNWKSWLLAFLLFRAFDIWKPFPVRRFEKFEGGLGIVADDVMAGVYGALVLFAAGWFNLY
jgi:phosphatidylglycerophosphatase A